MIITDKWIPRRSRELRCFYGDDEGADIDLVMVLRHINDNVCEISMAKGNMTSEAVIEIGLKAIEFGYSSLMFCALKGVKVTKWVEWVRDDEHYSYYCVDLLAAQREYHNEQECGRVTASAG